MHITDEVLAAVAAVYGQPLEMQVGAAMVEREFVVTHATVRKRRNHDVTLFITPPGAADSFVVIQKWNHQPGVWRAPSGGVDVGEDFVVGAVREGYEETGLSIRLERYLLRLKARFTCQLASGQLEQLDWVSHVCTASVLPESGPLQAIDTHEIKAVRVATVAELQSSIRAALLAAPVGGLHYRALLTDLTLALLYPGGIGPLHLPAAGEGVGM